MPAKSKTPGALSLALMGATLAAAIVVAPAHSELPASEVPGSSPAGAAATPTPEGVPTPMFRDPNFPKPEPVAPRSEPDSPPSLPGSGRQDTVPGS
jgi:hypothetical protein